MTIRVATAAISPMVQQSVHLGAAPVAPSTSATCAVIVTYHPDHDFFSRLKKVTPQVGQTVIVDNGSSDTTVEQLKQIAGREGIQLILNSRNEGIANALNRGAQWAAEHD